MFPQRFPEGLDGNFTAHLPRQLTTFDLRVAAAPQEAVGFPGKIVYSGWRLGLSSSQRRNFVAEYHPRFESFIHGGSCRKLTYTWAAGGPFHVDVLHNGASGEWNIYKFNAGRLISHITAQGYGEAMIRASGIGLSEEEPAFTFAGDAEECGRENRAQAECAAACEDASETWYPAEAGEKSGSPALVFGVVLSAAGERNLILIPRHKAEELAAIRDALAAKTWGEFKVKLPPQRLPELLTALRERSAWASFDLFYQAHAQTGARAEREALWRHYEALPPGERMPLDEDPFEMETVPGICEGHWPERPEQGMLRWLPVQICGRLGRRVSSRRVGDYVLFEAARAPEILAALERAGYECCWDEALVRRACGINRLLTNYLES